MIDGIMSRFYILLLIIILAVLCGIVYGRLKRTGEGTKTTIEQPSYAHTYKGTDAIHYDTYILTTKQRFVYLLAGCSLMFFIGYLFYQHFSIGFID